MADEQTMVPTRQTLLSRLRDWNDQDSWQVFFDTYWKLIYTTAVKAGLLEAEAEDVVQETVICVCQSMPEFRYDREKGSFKSWLLHLTWWRITDQLRKRPKTLSLEQRYGAEDESLEPQTSGPDVSENDFERLWDMEWAENLLDTALERVKNRIDPKQFQIFDLYVLKEWPISKICQHLQVSPTRIYLAKHRISRLLKKELQNLESYQANG